MFYLGENIRTTPADILIPISVEELVEKIRDTTSHLAQETIRLRRIAQLDLKTFKKMKLTLPYFIASSFSKKQRSSENFIESYALIIDFDDCLKTPSQSKQLLGQIKSQPEVFITFVSPNGCGIKIVLAFKEPLDDLQLFKRFYIDYVRNFAERIKLLGTLDTRTSDATRVCFLVHDANVYYNPNALKLDWQLWAEKNPPALPKKQQSTASAKQKSTLTPEVHREIVLKVNPKAPVKPKRDPHVPLLLKEVIQPIQTVLENAEITVLEIKPIHYGLKISCKQLHQLAEINVFYGKRGFSVVMSAKTTTSAELNKRVYQLVFNYLFNIHPDASES